MKSTNKSFGERLRENDIMQFAYKEWHRQKFVWYDWKDYIIDMYSIGHIDKLVVYTKSNLTNKIRHIMENEGRIFEKENESDIIIQCKIYFEYDYSLHFYKLNPDRESISSKLKNK